MRTALRAALTAWFAAALSLSFALLPSGNTLSMGDSCPMGGTMECCDTDAAASCPMRVGCALSCCKASETMATAPTLPPMLLPGKPSCPLPRLAENAASDEYLDRFVLALERPDPPPRA